MYPYGGYPYQQSGADIPGQVSALRTRQGPALSSQLFNAPVYQRQRVNPQQASGMERHGQDQYRAQAWRDANVLERAYNQANQQTQLQGMQNSAQLLGPQLNMVMPLLAQLFGGQL